jgi:hypothetical protein
MNKVGGDDMKESFKRKENLRPTNYIDEKRIVDE